MGKFLFLLASTALVAPFAAQAQDVPRDDAITVVATGAPIAVDLTGQPIAIIGADEIDSIQGPDLTRVLERLPGVSLTRNGGLGGFTGLRVRGANAEQVLVMVDGIRVADVAAPGGGYDFGNLLAGGIGKLELLRGSNSLVWGSDAIGGVLAVESRSPDGIEVASGYGARETWDAQVSGGLTGNDHGLVLSTGYTRSDGLSQAASGSEADGFEQWRVNGRGYLGLGGGLTAKLAGRYADSSLDIDGFPPPTFTFADTTEVQDTREIALRGGLDYVTETLVLDAGFQLSDTRRDYAFAAGDDPYYSTRGRNDRAELRGNWTPIGLVRVDFGTSHEWSRFADSDGTEKANISGAHALAGWYSTALTVAAGLRIDDHSRFGSEVTFGANGAFEFAPDWRVRASYGEGFKAPTLYQLFSDFGNAALSPERSRSYDIGIEKGDRNGWLHLAATLFRRDTRALIDYVSCFSAADPLCDDGRFGFYANVGKARAEGVEVELASQLSEHFRAQAAYSYVKATDRETGNDLARRPRHAVTVALDWITPLAGLELGADLRMVSGSFDNASNTTRIESHALGTLRASLPVSEAIELYGRIENLTDVRYETAAGYGTPGRSAFIGARARF